MATEERIVEYDLANERVVLASMAKDPKIRRQYAFSLTPTEFGDPRHQVWFRALSHMARAGLGWSEDTFAELAKGGDFGGYDYLRRVLEEYDPNTNLEFHIERLRLDSAKFGILQQDIPALAQGCEDPTAPPERLLAALKVAIRRLENHGRRFISGGPELVEGYYDLLKARKLTGHRVEGLGLKLLDAALVMGLSPAAPMSVIGARPMVGKSTLLAHLIRHRVAAKQGIFVCGWEMARDDYLDMMVSSETGVPAAVLVQSPGSLSPEVQYQVQEAVERYRNEDLLEIEENPFTKLEKPADRWADLNTRNLDYFEGTVAHASKTKRVIALDVFAKMLPDRRPDKVSEALVRIREMGKAYNVHICLLHHLNREAASGRPSLEGFKGSGAWEEEADLIFGLDRPILRASPARRRKMVDYLDIHLLKQRRGPAPLCLRYLFEGARYRLSGEVEIDLAMLEGDDEEPL